MPWQGKVPLQAMVFHKLPLAVISLNYDAIVLFSTMNVKRMTISETGYTHLLNAVAVTCRSNGAKNSFQLA